MERLEYFATFEEDKDFRNTSSDGNPVLGLDGIIQVRPSHLEDRYLIIYPDGEEQLISNPDATFMQGDLLTSTKQHITKKIWDWVKDKIVELNRLEE